MTWTLTGCSMSKTKAFVAITPLWATAWSSFKNAAPNWNLHCGTAFLPVRFLGHSMSFIQRCRRWMVSMWIMSSSISATRQLGLPSAFGLSFLPSTFHLWRQAAQKTRRRAPPRRNAPAGGECSTSRQDALYVLQENWPCCLLWRGVSQAMLLAQRFTSSWPAWARSVGWFFFTVLDSHHVSKPLSHRFDCFLCHTHIMSQDL